MQKTGFTRQALSRLKKLLLSPATITGTDFWATGMETLTKGCLASSVGCEFEPYIGCGDYLKIFEKTNKQTKPLTKPGIR